MSEIQKQPETGALPSPMGFAQSCQPRTYQEAMHFCDRLSKSGIVPKNFQNDAMAIFVCIETGERLGYSILQSLQNIAVINGKPTIYGDELMARVRRSGLMESIAETVKDGVATCTVKRKGEQEQTREFSMEDARKANLANKPGPWQQYPKRMLQMRARSWALRDVFTDALSGLGLREEVEDSIVDVRSGTPAQRPDAAKVVDSTSLQSVVEKIEEAKDAQELERVAELAKQLPSADAPAARERFVQRRRDLQAQAEPKKTKAQKLHEKVAQSAGQSDTADWLEQIKGEPLSPQDEELFK